MIPKSNASSADMNVSLSMLLSAQDAKWSERFKVQDTHIWAHTSRASHRCFLHMTPSDQRGLSHEVTHACTYRGLLAHGVKWSTWDDAKPGHWAHPNSCVSCIVPLQPAVDEQQQQSRDSPMVLSGCFVWPW